MCYDMFWLKNETVSHLAFSVGFLMLNKKGVGEHPSILDFLNISQLAFLACGKGYYMTKCQPVDT